ncbi:hypothetical protein AVEN_191680-1 [Araneus ventricosus]|uniref:Uncharacterized protein n=1 Tax=Araneus ventricosus TaxID=182803 RepID=A0A4Y2DRF7_ARAVE|nr:hypothetical protein AVEN_191680-1 [Araneus ventricosus]
MNFYGNNASKKRCLMYRMTLDLEGELQLPFQKRPRYAYNTSCDVCPPPIAGIDLGPGVRSQGRSPLWSTPSSYKLLLTNTFVI